MNFLMMLVILAAICAVVTAQCYQLPIGYNNGYALNAGLDPYSGLLGYGALGSYGGLGGLGALGTLPAYGNYVSPGYGYGYNYPAVAAI